MVAYRPSQRLSLEGGDPVPENVVRVYTREEQARLIPEAATFWGTAPSGTADDQPVLDDKFLKRMFALLEKTLAAEAALLSAETLTDKAAGFRPLPKLPKDAVKELSGPQVYGAEIPLRALRRF